MSHMETETEDDYYNYYVLEYKFLLLMLMVSYYTYRVDYQFLLYLILKKNSYFGL